jgi:hypothetical protein
MRPLTTESVSVATGGYSGWISTWAIANIAMTPMMKGFARKKALFIVADIPMDGGCGEHLGVGLRAPHLRCFSFHAL